MAANKLIDTILNRIYADDCNCILCDRELLKPDRYGLCAKCSSALSRNKGNICIKCGKPLYNEAEYCMVCQNNKRYFDRVNSPLIYKDEVEKLILNYKFYNKRYLSKYFVSFLVDEYISKGFDCDIIVPVPQTDKVSKERSFNQTELLAIELGSRLNIEVNTQLVKKIKETKHQATLGGKERQENVLDAFALAGNVKGKRILMIDDILTTGATLSELARVLYKGRPKSVEGLTLANAEYKPYSESSDTSLN